VEIRRLTEADKPSANYIASLAFMCGQRQVDWADDPNQADFVAYGAFDERGLQAETVILDHRVQMGPDVTLPMGGIAGVASLPAARGRGYVGALLRRSLEHMREAGQPVSALFPFSFAFYRRLGWEWVGVERRYSVSPQILEASPEARRCRQATPEDRPAIAATYKQFSKGYRGMLDRDEKLWAKLLDDAPNCYTVTFVCEGREGIEGYLTYRGGSSECIDLNEFICTTPSARRGLLGLLRRMNMQTRRFAWSAPDDDGLWYVFCHHGIETRIAPVTQARVVDVEAAVNAWKPYLQEQGSFRMRVFDKHAPWNDGVWQVEFNAEGAHAEKVQAEPDVSMDIQAFTQLYFGSANGYTLLDNERMTADNEDAMNAVCGCFGGPTMWMNDHF